MYGEQQIYGKYKYIDPKSHLKSYFCFNLLRKNVANGISTRIPSNIACSDYKQMSCPTVKNNKRPNSGSSEIHLTVQLINWCIEPVEKTNWYVKNSISKKTVKYEENLSNLQTEKKYYYVAITGKEYTKE